MVRDPGSQNYSDIAMRDLINEKLMTGPRMFGGALRPDYFADVVAV
jgi:hypothetical protein